MKIEQSQFLTELFLKSIRETNSFLLTSPLVFESEEQDVRIVVPALFITDFATIPAILKPLIDDDDPLIKDASVVHDFLYSEIKSNTYDLTRKQADLILKEAAISLQMPAWKANIVYLAVRAFGWKFYKQERNK